MKKIMNNTEYSVTDTEYDTSVKIEHLLGDVYDISSYLEDVRYDPTGATESTLNKLDQISNLVSLIKQKLPIV